MPVPFRSEAIDYAARRLEGDVNLVMPLASRIVLLLLFAAISVLIAILSIIPHMETRTLRALVSVSKLAPHGVQSGLGGAQRVRLSAISRAPAGEADFVRVGQTVRLNQSDLAAHSPFAAIGKVANISALGERPSCSASVRSCGNGSVSISIVIDERPYTVAVQQMKGAQSFAADATFLIEQKSLLGYLASSLLSR